MSAADVEQGATPGDPLQIPLEMRQLRQWTGLAQCAELNWQLRGEAEKRQVGGAKIALQHNLGLPGVAVVTMYRKAQLAG